MRRETNKTPKGAPATHICPFQHLPTSYDLQGMLAKTLTPDKASAASVWPNSCHMLASAPVLDECTTQPSLVKVAEFALREFVVGRILAEVDVHNVLHLPGDLPPTHLHHVRHSPLVQFSGGEKYPICPSQEKFQTVVLKGARNVSDTLSNPPMKFILYMHISPIFRLLMQFLRAVHLQVPQVSGGPSTVASADFSSWESAIAL